MLRMTWVPMFSYRGNSSRRKASIPTEGMPTQLSIPPQTSAMRGPGIAGPPQAVNALDHNRAQLTDGEAVGIVFKIIIGAGGGHDGVFEHRAAQLHG